MGACSSIPEIDLRPVLTVLAAPKLTEPQSVPEEKVSEQKEVDPKPIIHDKITDDLNIILKNLEEGEIMSYKIDDLDVEIDSILNSEKSAVHTEAHIEAPIEAPIEESTTEAPTEEATQDSEAPNEEAPEQLQTTVAVEESVFEPNSDLNIRTISDDDTRFDSLIKLLSGPMRRKLWANP
jgi:hypothetical protein